MASTHTKYRFPWREHNKFHLLVDGQRYFPSMLAAIGKARHSILLEMYLVISGRVMDRFIEHLQEAAQRGVAVYVMFDDFGARGLSPADRQRMLSAGIHFCFYNPLRFDRLRRSLLRDHRKLLVVDSALAFTGGAGITDDFWCLENTGGQWLDVVVQARGSVVADWRELFMDLWRQWSDVSISGMAPDNTSGGGQLGRVVCNQTPRRLEVKRALIKRVQSAERRVWLSTAYFVPSLKLRRVLRKAAANEVDVRLLLPGPQTDHPAVRHAGRRYYQNLLRSGVKIYEFQPRFLHAKVLLCDNWVSIGSSNIDRWGQRWNLDANQEIDDALFADEVATFFHEGIAQAEYIDLTVWLQRPWYRRALEWFWGRIDAWIHSR